MSARGLRAAVWSLSCALALSLGWFTFQRSVLFGDGVLLFADATRKAPADPRPAYHLARTLEGAGRAQQATLAYREALRRSGARALSVRRSAANGLAALLARRGELAEAERVLRAARVGFPNDPTLARNLIKLLRASQREGEAERIEQQVLHGSQDARVPRAEPPR